MVPMSHCSDLQAQPTKPAVVSQPRLALGLVLRCPPLGQCLPVSVCAFTIPDVCVVQLYATSVWICRYQWLSLALVSM